MNKLELWLRYFLIWPGLPPMGDPREAHVIIIQAFGRNTCPDSCLHYIKKLHEKYNHDWATINRLHLFGYDPGEPNRSLARKCQQLVNRYHLPVITQWEIALAFDLKWYELHWPNIICVWPPAEPQKRFTTWEVKSITAEIMKSKGWTKAIELAHKRQITRSFLIIRKLLKETPVIIEQKTRDFDPNSVQKWTRNWYYWIIYEIGARAHHLIYRLVI